MAPASIPSCCLTADQKDALIDAVRQRPVIWDCSLDAYQDVQNRRAAFAELAELLSDEKQKYTGPEMQVEWKKLRDIFNRTLKKVVAQGGGDQEVTWRYWQKLQFIADHECSQIFKAMQKWSKKVPMPTGVTVSPSSTSTAKRKRPPQQHLSAVGSRASPLSMVQQLTEVAQSARELLKMEGDEAGTNGEVKVEARPIPEEPEDGPQQGENSGGNDALGQILLLSSQLNHNTASCSSVDGTDTNGAVEDSTGEQQPPTTAESDFPMRLLNEWLLKAEAGIGNIGAGNDGRKRKRWENGGTAMAVAVDGGGASAGSANDHGTSSRHRGSVALPQKQHSANDQFDIFGLFIASQVRSLTQRCAQSGLRLKRALTELCFQFEEDAAEETNAAAQVSTNGC